MNAAIIFALCTLNAPRVLIAANNVGSPLELPLKYAEADATAVAETLIELGIAQREEIDVLLGAKKNDVLARASALHAIDRPVIVFLSSHGGPQGAHLDGEVLAWSELARALEAIKAKTVIAFVDACQSGALLTPKGFKRGPPRNVVLRPSIPAGRVLITSSGAHELSNESILLQASPFAQSLISALRGGGDNNGDGQVTVEETYTYLYGRTVAATLAAPAGPQHPERAIDLKGAGEVVLAEPQRGLRVRRSTSGTGACYLLDNNESRVIAELPAGDERPRVIAAKTHVVKCVDGGELRVAILDHAAAVRELVIDTLDFRRRPLELALAKGPERTATSRLSIAAAITTDENKNAHPAVALRYRRGSKILGWNLQLLTSPGDKFGRGIASAGAGYVLPFWGGPDARIEVGLSAGTVFGDALGLNTGPFLAGQYVMIDWGLAHALALQARFDLETAIHSDRTYVFFLFSLGVARDF